MRRAKHIVINLPRRPVTGYHVAILLDAHFSFFLKEIEDIYYMYRLSLLRRQNRLTTRPPQAPLSLASEIPVEGAMEGETGRLPERDV